MALTVAYQGERGAFSEAAARSLLGAEVTAVPCATFEAMFDSVVRGDADCCMAPIENSLAGSIHRNYDLLLESQLRIHGETKLRVVHNLIAPPGVAIEAIREVLSHPVALAQCVRFLREHPAMTPAPVHDTAGAVRIVMESRRGDQGAIASVAAAEAYGAEILVRGVEDNVQNFTRFLLIAPSGFALPAADESRWKTSLVFRIANQPGALFRALGAFASHGIDLAKIESRPIEGRPWEYAFYLDLAGRDSDPAVARSIAELAAMSERIDLLGSYPAARENR